MLKGNKKHNTPHYLIVWIYSTAFSNIAQSGVLYRWTQMQLWVLCKWNFRTRCLFFGASCNSRCQNSINTITLCIILFSDWINTYCDTLLYCFFFFSFFVVSETFLKPWIWPGNDTAAKYYVSNIMCLITFIVGRNECSWRASNK